MEHVNWKDKMNSIPIKEDPDSAWKEMEVLLNQHLPIARPSASGVTMKTIVAKLVSMLGYVLPAAAMITAGTYIIVPKIKENKRVIHSNTEIPKKKKNTPLVKIFDTVPKQKDTLERVIAVPDSMPQPIVKPKARKRLPVKTSATQLEPSTTVKATDTVTKFNTKPKSRARRVMDTVRKEDSPANPASRARNKKIVKS